MKRISDFERVNCQNGGTQINGCTCVCPGGLFGKHCESDQGKFCNVIISNVEINKKVLLRERKRHTDRGVSSTTRDGVPPQPGPTGGGVPEVGYPPSGYPLSRSDGGGYLRWGTPSSGYLSGQV